MGMWHPIFNKTPQISQKQEQNHTLCKLYPAKYKL